MLINLDEYLILECLSYLHSRDLEKLFFLNKKFNLFMKSDLVWNVIGARDHPILNIQNFQEFQTAQLYISENMILEFIKNDSWSKTWYNSKILNFNKVQDHIIPSLVKFITKLSLQKKILESIYNTFSNKMSFDWRMAFNYKIEELADQLDKNEIEMYKHKEFLTNKYINK